MTIPKILRKKGEVVVKISNGFKRADQVIIKDADKEIKRFS